MSSPFPGMDPYLEGYLWPDVHNALASKFRQLLTPQIRPNYVARLEIYLMRDAHPEAEVGIMYPDVEVLKTRREPRPEPKPVAAGGVAVAAPPTEAPPLTLPLPDPIPVRIPTIEIRDVAQNQLVTSIEILSPVNKREPGLSTYRDKRQQLRQAGVHLLEIDLLRRGERPFFHARLPASDYLITLIRANTQQADVWPLALRDPLPTLPVPLRKPDPDVSLPLTAALQDIYDEAAYDLSIDYTQAPPPPALSDDDVAWMQDLLAATAAETEAMPEE